MSAAWLIFSNVWTSCQTELHEPEALPFSSSGPAYSKCSFRQMYSMAYGMLLLDMLTSRIEPLYVNNPIGGTEKKCYEEERGAQTEQTHSLSWKNFKHLKYTQKVALSVKISEIYTSALRCRHKWSVPKLSLSWVEWHCETTGTGGGPAGEPGHAPLRSVCFLDCRRVSAPSKTHPRSRKGPQTWQEEVTDSFVSRGGSVGNPSSGLVIFMNIFSFCKYKI